MEPNPLSSDPFCPKDGTGEGSMWHRRDTHHLGATKKGEGVKSLGLYAS